MRGCCADRRDGFCKFKVPLIKSTSYGAELRLPAAEESGRFAYRNLGGDSGSLCTVFSYV